MDLMKRTSLTIHSERPPGTDLVLPSIVSDSSLSNVLRLVGSFDDLDDGLPPNPPPPVPDWSGVIERVHQAATRVREVEAQAHEQELRVQELLQRVREDVNRAAERARAADARAADLQTQCETLLKAADERVKAAEERARIAEGWLAQVYDAIVSEFGTEPDGKPTAR